MPNIPVFNIGGTEYNLKDAEARSDISSTKALVNTKAVTDKGGAIDISGDFEQGGINASGSQYAATNRCRSKQYYPVDAIRYIYTSVPSGYSIGTRFYDMNGTYITYGTLRAYINLTSVPEGAVLCRFLFSTDDDSDITPTDVAALDVSAAFKAVSESYSDELHQVMLQNFSLEGAYKYDGYQDGAYKIVDNANHKTTDFIYLKAGDTFEYTLVASKQAINIYDMDFGIVGSISGGSVTEYVSGTYTMAGDGYIRASNRYVSYPNGYIRFGVAVPDMVKRAAESSGNPIQEYFADEMDDTINKVLALRTEPCIVFPIVTDIHYKFQGTLPADQFNHTIDNILNFTKQVKCDFVLNLGDSSDGRAPLATQVEYSNAQARRFAELSVPYFFTQGNHELNIYSGGSYSGTDKLDLEQIYTLFFNCLPQNVVRNPDNFTDYYVDFPAFNIRLIMLNMAHPDATSAYHVDDGTVSWYRDTALDAEKTILLCTHYSPIANHNSYPNVYTDTNIGSLETITEDFVEGGGTLINLYGHSHSDFHFETPYLQVSFNCARCAAADISQSAYDWLRENSDIVSPSRTIGTVTEDSWTVCVMRPLSQKIDFIRFGAGADRTGLSY